MFGAVGHVSHIKSIIIETLENIQREGVSTVIPIRIPTKRGRKPRLSLTEPMTAVSQITVLGNFSVAKAS